MSESRDLDSIASRIRAAREGAHSLESISAGESSFSIEDAYAVAARLHRGRLAAGAVPCGRKLGFTNAEMWSIYGVGEPVWAWMYDDTVRLSASPRDEASLGRLVEPKIEPEIVLGFAAAPAGESPEAIVDALAWVAVGFELVQSHFPGWRFTAADTIADGALHGGLCVGPRTAVRDLGNDPISSLRDCELRLFRDGEKIADGRGANALGSPLTAVGHLCGVLAGQKAAPLAAGEIVTTGTLTPAYDIRPGERWAVEMSGIELAGFELALID